MITTAPEHFYKRKIVASGAALPIVGELPDLSLDATGKDLILSTGDRNRFAIISGNTDIEVKNGSYDFVGGYLRTFVSGTSMGETGLSPTIKLYGLQQDYPIREGDITLPDNSNDRPSMAAYHQTFQDGDLVYKKEDFDGALSSLNTSAKYVMGGFNSRPYIEVEDFLHHEASKSSKTEEKILQGLVSTGCITMQWTEGVTTFATDNPRSGRIFLREVDKSDFGGTDPSTYYAPIWKRTDGTTGLECDYKMRKSAFSLNEHGYGGFLVGKLKYADSILWVI